ncbi:MAG: DNA integrity scanning protein DisA nucleotide-binding domain protein [Actinomycetota bacterium]|nr:DNA integrity scanning protein DisA nucleotide-binding domain protein [Actinomycetota bacterium]
MTRRTSSINALRRLEEELDEDGVPMPEEEDVRRLLIEELLAVRRPPVHERRRPFYGSFVVPPGRSLLVSGDLADLVDLDGFDLERSRRFADGRSTFLVRLPGGERALACFRRSVQYEADLVEIQEATGAAIAQRSTLGAARLFVSEGVVEWNGNHWRHRPTAAAQLWSVTRVAPGASHDVIEGVLDLCVHWLSPGQTGGTVVLVLAPSAELRGGVDYADSFPCPPVSVRRRQHFPAFLAAMAQTDLAVVLDADGTARRMGVGLRSSVEADRLISDARGMRHRSARRFSFDHPETLVFVVSEDGPVTVFSDGAAVAFAEQALRGTTVRPVAPTDHQRCVKCRRLVEVVHGVSVPLAAACPVCAETEGFEEATIVGVVKEVPWIAEAGRLVAAPTVSSPPAHLDLGDVGSVPR